MRAPSVFRFREHDLRGRFRPRVTLCWGLVSTAHWIDIVLLVVFFVLLSRRLVLHPGVIVELPREEPATGTRYGHTAVVLSLETPGNHGRQEIVFFDDERFSVLKQDERELLRRRLATAAARDPDMPLLIEADRRVEHGTLVMMYRMAQEAGLRQVNLLTSPPPAAEDDDG